MIQLQNMKKYLEAFLKEKPFFFSIIRPKEASLYQKFKPFQKPVLDLGCGDGFFAQTAFGKLHAGIDPDKKAIQEAKTRKVYAEIKDYSGRVIPYPDQYFKTILSNSTVEHIPNIDEVIKETSRVLKKGGIFYFTTVTDIWPEYLFGSLILGKIYKQYFINKSKHYNMYSVQTWKKKLKKYGLEIIESQHYLNNKKILRLFDISHYFSVPSLVCKKLFHRWVLFPAKEKYFQSVKDYILKETKENSQEGPYLFIAAKKIK